MRAKRTLLPEERKKIVQHTTIQNILLYVKMGFFINLNDGKISDIDFNF